jgi:hypothetical protein
LEKFRLRSKNAAIETGLVEEIGFSAGDASQLLSITDAIGSSQDGYLIAIPDLHFLGIKTKNVAIGVFDFTHFQSYGAHGLLGWDIIRQLRLELDGANGMLKIF